MKLSYTNNFNREVERYYKLLEIMHNYPLLRCKVIALLNLDACERKTILDYWLDQMQQQKTCDNLRHALSCLNDDKLSAEVIKFFTN